MHWSLFSEDALFIHVQKSTLIQTQSCRLIVEHHRNSPNSEFQTEFLSALLPVEPLAPISHAQL